MKGLKNTVFIFLMALIWLPLFQELTRVFKEPVLTGAFVKPPKPEFSVALVQSLVFQKNWEDFENSNFGFRGFFVKIRNSVDHILFGDLSVPDNISGKDNFIFSEGSIKN